MKNLSKTLLLVLGTVLGSSQTAYAQAPVIRQQISFAARAVQTIPGKADQIGLIYKSGSDMRLEFLQGDRAIIQILRPTFGISRLLDVASHTYTEVKSAPQPPEVLDGYTTPCPALINATGQTCERTGTEVISGVQTERWEMGLPGQPPMVILWDSVRRHALRQEYPEGIVMTMTFMAMEDVFGRNAEYWAVEYKSDTETKTGGWWFDPALRLVVREELPDGTSRHLENIKVGPIDPAMFDVPQGWQLQPVTR